MLRQVPSLGRSMSEDEREYVERDRGMQMERETGDRGLTLRTESEKAIKMACCRNTNG